MQTTKPDQKLITTRQSLDMAAAALERIDRSALAIRQAAIAAIYRREATAEDFYDLARDAHARQQRCISEAAALPPGSTARFHAECAGAVEESAAKAMTEWGDEIRARQKGRAA